MKASATLRRQTSESEPLLLLWRPRPGGGREGLLARLSACTNAKCTCTEVTLDVRGVHEGLVSATLVDRGQVLRVSSQPAPPGVEVWPDEWELRARVDVFDGQVQEQRLDEATPPPEEVRADWLAWLAEECDGELLDLFARLFARRRRLPPPGTPTWQQQDWSEWEPGDLIGWNEVYSMDRWDFFRLDGKQYAALDLHCVKPGCACREVRMIFSEVERVEVPDETEPDWMLRQVGTFVLQPPYVKLTEVEAERLPEARLLALWQAFRERHRHRNLLADRHLKLKRLGPELVALSRRQRGERQDPEPERANPGAPGTRATGAVTGSKVGRNDPCPCGSGKKFKRCCGQ